MKNLTEDHAYSMEEGFLYLPGSDLDRLNTRRISTDKVEKLLKKIGIDSSIYNILSKSFYDDDIMRWSSMLTIAALSLKEACIQGDGYTIEIVEQGTYYDNYTIEPLKKSL
ncbi:MAG: hypothetical protein KBI35_10420 [Ruminococcus sp.]|nr:hypothetical protein [Ruminococcus sp.]